MYTCPPLRKEVKQLVIEKKLNMFGMRQTLILRGIGRNSGHSLEGEQRVGMGDLS